MKSNLAVPCFLLLLLALGCTSWAPPGDDLRTPVPPAEKRRESPRPFYFGGIYRISGCERFGAASGLAAPTPNGALSFADGGIKITVKATPFGMKLQIENKLYESLVLDGTRCTLIDAKGTSHAVELRPPSLLWPEREMMTQ